jgi:hypothetical protein
MQLDALRGRLAARLARAEALFFGFAPGVKRNCRHDQVAFLDGLLSYTWQAWCRFCRDLVVYSCLGAQTKAGVVLPVSVAPASQERVSYLAIQAKRGKPAAAGHTNAVWRYEPTWGDVSVLVKIVTLANPANTSQLLATFGGVTKGPLHLQRVRNASAHLNDQSFADLLAIQLYYLGSPIRFPCEASFWLDTVNADFAFVAWLDEMRHLANTAV